MKDIFETVIRAVCYIGLFWYTFDEAMVMLTGIVWLGTIPWQLITLPAVYILISLSYDSYQRHNISFKRK